MANRTINFSVFDNLWLQAQDIGWFCTSEKDNVTGVIRHFVQAPLHFPCRSWALLPLLCNRDLSNQYVIPQYFFEEEVRTKGTRSNSMPRGKIPCAETSNF